MWSSAAQTLTVAAAWAHPQPLYNIPPVLPSTPKETSGSADTENNRVLEFPPSNLVTDGSAAIAIGCADLNGGGCQGTSPTTLQYPSGLTFDPQGNLWVSDSGNSRVLEFLPSNLVTGGAAATVIGQADFSDSECDLSGVSSTSLCYPYRPRLRSSGKPLDIRRRKQPRIGIPPIKPSNWRRRRSCHRPAGSVGL